MMNPDDSLPDHDGYAGGLAYPAYFHREQTPAWLHASVAALGHRPPRIDQAFAWCDLGCGSALTALVVAACYRHAQVTAVDIDAAALAQARALAHAAGLDNLQLRQADLSDPHSLAEVAAGGFDYVVSHGLWSWVSPAVQQVMVRSVAGALKPGGVMALAYMSHPGATPLQGAQRLLHEAGQLARGDAASQVATAMALLQQMAAAGAGYFVEQPGVVRQLQAMAREPAGYIAHEFMGRHWQPQHSAEVIAQWAAQGCAFIGSATVLENIDALSVPAAVLPLLQQLPPGPLAETARDLARNQSLRRDLFVQAGQRLDGGGHLQVLDGLCWARLPAAPASVSEPLLLDTRIGPVPVPAVLLSPLLQALASGPQDFARLRQLPAFVQTPGLLNQALQVLCWQGWIHPVPAQVQATVAAGDSAACQRLQVLLDAHRAWPALQLLPAMGTAVPA